MDAGYERHCSNYCLLYTYVRDFIGSYHVVEEDAICEDDCWRTKNHQVPQKKADLYKLSKTDIEALDWIIKPHNLVSYDEIKKKPHDIS